jgi:UrcA family protein
MTKIPMRALCLLGGAVLAATAAPAFAQYEDEEITVTGRYGTVPDSAPSLSQAISYRDLDLSTQAGRAELRHRVKLTARYLCGKLGESNSTSGVGQSCQQAATEDALKRVGTIEEGFAPRGTAWAAGSPWAPPYPSDWSSRYPD